MVHTLTHRIPFISRRDWRPNEKVAVSIHDNTQQVFLHKTVTALMKLDRQNLR
uniref:Uncharacterized protein n=1 Tax=Arion vulgaris TaxID=1028688 RepID=A0A0B7AG99_9EUPU